MGSGGLVKNTRKGTRIATEPADPWLLLQYLEERASRGDLYRRLEVEGLVEDLIDGRLSRKKCAEKLGVSNRAVSYAVNAHRADRLEKELEGKVREGGVSGGGGGSQPIVGWVDLYHASDEEIERITDEFAQWRSRHFLTPQGKPYQTAPFHRRWIVAILKTIRDGKNLLILSPPRHGKTELMIHFDLFFVTRVNPNISLVRVCKSEGLAKKALGSCLDHLENNEGLLLECRQSGVLKPTQEYKPPLRGGKSWNNAEATVATRTIVGLKSPTWAAVGSGGTLLSRDGDVFTIDDIEDQKTVYTAEMREKTQQWFGTDLMSRKESHTAMIYIGSRQHPDDVPNSILENPEWETIVETAHDEAACEVEDPDNPENWHKHVDCVLWPEVRSYEWLMGIKYDPQRAATYPMIYLNEPTDEDVDVFSRAVVDMALDKDRVTHAEPELFKLNYPADFYDELGIHHPFRLIGGLDPSGSGYQASFLWAVDLAAWKIYAVDFENRLGGGLHKARDIIERWDAFYGLKTWVIEENLYHGAFVKDELLRAYCSRSGVQLIPHETGTNKWDQTMGVGAIAGMMREGQVSIPFGNVQSQAKWKMYRSQLINFSRDKRGKGGRSANSKTDIVMASWFPLQTMQRWRKEWLASLMEAEERFDQDPFGSFAETYNNLFAPMGMV